MDLNPRSITIYHLFGICLPLITPTALLFWNKICFLRVSLCYRTLVSADISWVFLATSPTSNRPRYVCNLPWTNTQWFLEICFSRTILQSVSFCMCVPLKKWNSMLLHMNNWYLSISVSNYISIKQTLYKWIDSICLLSPLELLAVGI